MAASKPRQFFTADPDYVTSIIENSTAKNTKRLTKLAVHALREYMESKGLSSDFESLPHTELDRLLGTFYVELRNQRGEMYKKTTMMSYRHGIQRHLQTTRPDIDIIHGAEFRESCKVFKGVTMELKRQGLGGVDHHPPISDADIAKLYEYLSSSDSAEVLQHKVHVCF
jgi:hypothetical protein